MADTLTKLRIVTAFNLYRVGDVIERIPALARDMLKARWYGRKLVEEVKDVPVAVPATAEVRAEAATVVPPQPGLPPDAGTATEDLNRSDRRRNKR